jgi:hypothetical protein
VRVWPWFLISLGIAGCRSDWHPALGFQYPPLPPEYREESGTLLQDTAGGTDYAVSWISRHHRPDIVWLSRELGRSPTGKPSWMLVDTLTIAWARQDLLLVVGQCAVAGRSEPDVLAVVKMEDADSLRTVASAWSVNRVSGRFVPISVAGVVCRNESYGE